MSPKRALRLFEAYGVELEYMIVRAASLDVLPIADQVIRHVAGQFVSEVEQGPIAWSNELVMHVIELKTNGPARSLAGLPGLFQQHVGRVSRILEPLGGRLMPSAMHPWMDPAREMRLWPHEYSPIYETYHRIFDCRGHGWSNLQSVHLNLPFSGDEEFGRLHAAIRLVLPLVPALAASSPVVDGRATGVLDSRLSVYRANARRIPSITGQVVPEQVFTRERYERSILEPMYRDIAPLDPEGILRHEWLNSRGAIARFDRGSIEIRLIDMQECPRADLAVCAAIVAVVQALVAERWTRQADQRAVATERLDAILQRTTEQAEQATIRDSDYLHQFGFRGACRAGELWQHLVETAATWSGPSEAVWAGPLGMILERGTLARRIVNCLKPGASPQRLRAVYRELCNCLAAGRMFEGCD